MVDSSNRVVVEFVGRDSGLTSTATSLSEQFARLESSGKGLASVFAQASEAAQKLGSTGNQGAAGAEKLGSAATSASRGAEQLAKSLGLNFQAAKSFSESLGLAEGKAAAALAKLQALNAVGATVQSRFEVLNKELGITGEQFLKLDRAVAAEAAQLAQLRTQTEQATIAQQNQAAASARQAKAAAEAQQGLIGVGLASGALAGAIGGVFAKGSQDFLTFNESIKEVGVNTKSLGTEDLKSLSDNVEHLGVTTSKTPLEIAKLDESLSKTSLRVNEVKEVTEGLIHASEGLGEAPEKVGKAVSSAVNQFGLAVADYGKVEDLFVNTLQNTNTNLGDFSQALINVGPNAKSSGQSIESTAFALSLFAQQGLTGGKAGTDLGIVFNRLSIASAQADPELQKLVRGSARARAAFDLLQVGVRDANGQLKPFPEILEVLRGSLGKLDNPSEKSIILNAIFGTGGGAQAVNLLLNSTTDNIARAKDATTNYAGAAKAAGEQLLTGPDGAVKQFSGSIGALNLQIGKFVGGGLEPFTRAATDLLNEFLALPAPVQYVVIGVTGLVGILATAVAAVTAFQLANGAAALKLAQTTTAAILDTIATNANAAAKYLAAAATGTLTEAQQVSGEAFLANATKAGLFAGAVAAIGLAVDTFQKVNAAANETRAGLDDFTKAQDKLTEAELKSNDAATQKKAAADLETQANKRIQDSIGGVQQALDYLRKVIDFFSLRHLLEEFAKLDVVPQPIKDLVNGIVNFLPKVGTAAEAAANNATAAFGEVLDSADKVQSEFQKLFKGGFENATKEEIEALNGEIEASIKVIEKAKPANEADAKAKELRLKQLKEEQAQLASLIKTKSDADNAPGQTIGGEAKDDPKAAKAAAKEEGQDLKEERQDEKTQEERSFQDEQKTKQQNFADQEKKKDQAYTDDKEKRTAAFTATQAAIDKQNQTLKETRAAAFAETQAEIDKQNQLEKEARAAEYQEQREKAEAVFRDDQRKRDEALKKTQTDAGGLLSLEGSRGTERSKLLGENRTQGAVDKLSDADLQGKDGKALTAEQLAALAKQTAGVGNINNKRDEEQAQFALKALNARLDKAQKEQERKDDEAYKLKVKKEDLKFKQEQEKIDAEKEKQKKDAARKEKTDQEKIDAQQEIDKRKRANNFRLEQEKADRQHETDKENEKRRFEKDVIQKDERDFKDEQRRKDRENADKIKDIIESAKIKPPEPSSNAPVPKNVGSNPISDINYTPDYDHPTPRFTGGPVAPGQAYLGGERGIERIDFGQGRDALVGSRGPQLFTVNRPGYVHPNHSPYTQAVVQTAHYQHQSVGRSPSVQVNTAPVIYRDDAMLSELRALRSEVGALRSVNQTYNIESVTPMAEVYKSQKIAARIWR